MGEREDRGGIGERRRGGKRARGEKNEVLIFKEVK